MSLFSRLCLGTVGIGVVVCITCSQTSGQSVWLDPTFDQGVAVEILKPDFLSPGDHDYSGYHDKAYASVWFLSARVRISERVRLIFELPSSHYDATVVWRWWDYDGYYYISNEVEMDGQSMIGTPLLGIEQRSAGPVSFYQQLSVRLPLEDKPTSREQSLGLVADVNRVDAFFPGWATLKCRFGASRAESSGVGYHFFVGADWMLPPDDVSLENRLYLGYGGQLWLYTPLARMGAGITGQFLATEEGGSFGEYSIHQLGLTTSFGSGRICPGMHFRVPLGDDYDLAGVQFIWGLNLLIKLGSIS